MFKKIGFIFMLFLTSLIGLFASPFGVIPSSAPVKTPFSKVKKLKLFVSQPMNGKTDKEIVETRQMAVKEAEEIYGEEFELIDSFFQSAPCDANPLWFLGKSLELMSGADVVYFAEGWKDARGCRIEHQCAIDYGIFVICKV